MAEYLWQRGAGQGMGIGRCEKRAGEVLVQVGSADPCGNNIDQHLVLAKLAGRISHLLQPDVAGTVENRGLHRLILGAGRRLS